MSVINKMLQDLDKRHAAPAGPDSGSLAQQVRPVKQQAVGSNLFWRILGGVMVVVVAWVIWVMWQITPRPVVTDLAYQWPGSARTSPQPAALTVPGHAAAPVPANAAAPPALAPAAAQPVVLAASPATARPAQLPESAKIDMLRLATELLTPIRSRGARPVPLARSTDRLAAAQPKARAGKITARLTEPAPAKEAPARRARTARAAPDPGSIDKRVDITPRERAESEFRRAMSQVNHGRMAEGMEGLRATLAADPAFELARQTLIALLLESRRTDEAAGLLQEGLAINPADIGYAMLLARIHVERGDPNRALALLRKYETTAQAGVANAQYHGFVAALYQRLGRHIEAVEQYQGALRLRPGMGAWWVGLGISQEALSRPKDAAESFNRAKGTGNLDTELLAYVERRLERLR
jgi:MSHA biogenesis protein MshN